MDRDRYRRAAHAMQSGVAMEMNYDASPCEPKHLRVGINAAMSDHGGLAGLLIKKGLITEEEYLEAITEAMEREKQSYEDRLTHRYGRKVTLG